MTSAADFVRGKKLEDLDHAQLLSTVRSLLVEANALSSRIAAVNEIGIAINQSLQRSKILEVIASKAKSVMDFEHCSVCLKAPDDSLQVEVLFGAKNEGSIAGDSATLLATDNLGYVLRTGQPRLVRDGSASPFLQAFNSQIILPLMVEGSVFGTINFAASSARIYSQDDLRIGSMFSLQLAGAIRSANHVRELEAAQDELRRCALELEDRNEELDAFSYTIAHDLKTPLSSMMLKADIYQRYFEGQVPEKSSQLVASMKGQVITMTGMINQLLWLARLRDASISLVVVDVEQTAAAAIARLRDQIDAANIRVSVNGELPRAFGDEQWIEEIFTNLISNAVKYMGHANPAPQIILRGVGQGNHVRYEVQDTGVGISPEDRARLFEKFSRLNTVKAEGLGLGLSIVRRMVGKLKGQIGVESVRGEGSTFWFRLPAAMPDWQENEPHSVALLSTGRLSPKWVELQRNR